MRLVGPSGDVMAMSRVLFFHPPVGGSPHPINLDHSINLYTVSVPRTRAVIQATRGIM